METDIDKLINEALETYKSSMLFLCFVSIALEAVINDTSQSRSNVPTL